jgi:two-component system C4-dicarboxylate transport sensor histidine kinase DctB
VRNLKTLFVILAYLVTSAGLVWIVFSISFRANLTALNKTGEIRLAQAEDRLLGQLESFRELANFLSRHPVVQGASLGQVAQTEINELLLRAALTAGADAVYMLDRLGVVIASSNFEDPYSFIGWDYSKRPDVISASTGRLGVHHGIEPADQTRDFFYTRGILADGVKPSSYLVVKVNAALLEFNWRIDENVVTFIDDDGVSFLANRPGLLLRREDPDTETRYPENSLRPFYKYEPHDVSQFQLWTFDDGLEVPRETLIADRSIPLIDMRARIFMDASEARRPAKLQAALAAAVMAITGLFLLIVSQRRRRIIDRLALEEAANARLEARVAERTQQLEHAQSELIQASKLTALGQMSAGISHELNQPLATIQNYAENSKKFLAMGRTEDTLENLSRISQQTTRMGRIIKNLHSFARKETEPLEALDICEILKASVNLAEKTIFEAGVIIKRTGQTTPMIVQAGNVRLQQVIVNILTNAVDAMADQAEKIIYIDLFETGDFAHLTIADNGPGLAEVERVFEPFYTTKDIGASKGLGLGLSISYGIIGSFRGDLKASNLDTGGAEFTVVLPIFDPAEAL